MVCVPRKPVALRRIAVKLHIQQVFAQEPKQQGRGRQDKKKQNKKDHPCHKPAHYDRKGHPSHVNGLEQDGHKQTRKDKQGRSSKEIPVVILLPPQQKTADKGQRNAHYEREFSKLAYGTVDLPDFFDNHSA